MTTKATGWLERTAEEKPPRLSGVMRAVRNWAVLEEHDTVLDLFCRDGALLSALSKSMRLCVCGICDDPEMPHRIRTQLADSDIVYAEPDDIPWRDNAFDAVLGSELVRKEKLRPMLAETMRVLRPGGQAVMATKMLPFGYDEYPNKGEIMREMQSVGFENISWRISGLWGVAIGWKKNDPV